MKVGDEQSGGRREDDPPDGVRETPLEAEEVRRISGMIKAWLDRNRHAHGMVLPSQTQ